MMLGLEKGSLPSFDSTHYPVIISLGEGYFGLELKGDEDRSQGITFKIFDGEEIKEEASF